jgi:2-oxoglutarate ferredoxin oxidoreductase subunit alpha
MQPRVNDLAVKIATVNGTGSSSANIMLMKAIFHMGIPVSGKNVFPSNIQGLPTWYEIRCNANGHICRTDKFDMMVAMNAQTYERDLAEVRSDGWFLYDSTWPLDGKLTRDDVTFIGVPLSKMCNENFEGSRTRILMKNISYVGALAALFDIDVERIKSQLQKAFATKQHLMDANMTAIGLGYDYVTANYDCPLPIRLEAMENDADNIMINGNTGAAMGCLFAGATVGAWYPITPSTSLMDSFSFFCHKYRIDPETGEKNFCIIQAEDELSAIGMTIGAAWAGARTFTPTSGPGISLMAEFIGFAYYTENPIVLFDIQRTGPSTGMPTRTQQGDIMTCAYASHGDTKHICVFPADPAECFYLTVAAFDLADRFQTPVFVVSDLDIGMNDWTCPALEWDDNYVADRGKVVHAEDIEKMDEYFRYLDIDGDGVPYRSLPGEHPKGAFFTRGSGHNKYARYTEDSAEYQEVTERLLLKHSNASKSVPKPFIQKQDGATDGIISIGSCHGAVMEAFDTLGEQGIKLDYLRVKAFPFSPEVHEFLEKHDKIYIVEQNRDAQLKKMLMMETEVPKDKLISVRHYSGTPMSAGHVIQGITAADEVPV